MEENCVPVQLEGTVGTTAKLIGGLESGNYVEVFIQNTSSNTLYLSMDGKQHWLTITATVRLRGTAKHPIKVKEEDWYVKGSGADINYEIALLKIVE